MSKKMVVGLIVILIFAGFAAYSFRASLNPYVTFAEAAEVERQVQVLGTLVEKESVGYNRETGSLHFFLEDEEAAVAPVIYKGAKPNNFEHAESVVVIGRFDGAHFVADKLLVKCPSKYDDEGVAD